MISTGHYVRKVFRDGYYFIAPAADRDKDQTFFLWGLQQNILERMLLPMGDWTKNEVRVYAAKRGFERTATKRIVLVYVSARWITALSCSVKFRRMLCREKDNFSMKAGLFRLARRISLLYDWSAQRIGYSFEPSCFRKEIHKERNEVILAPLASLYKEEMLLKDWNIVDTSRLLNSEDVIVRIRYRKQANHCTVSITDENLLHVLLREPLESIASGQAAAFYDEAGLLLGGGIIL